MAVEMTNGSVMLNVRTSSLRNRRVVTISPDGTKRWSPGEISEQLLEPVCMASIIRYSAAPKSRILFSNPDTLEPIKGDNTPGGHRTRQNLTVKLSYDEGRTWPAK